MPPTAPETNAADPILTTASTTAPQWTPAGAVASIPPHMQPPSTAPSTPLAYFHMLQRLKTTKREGWRRFGILHGESIADHMYRMSMITMLAPPSLRAKLNIDRCVRMALIHDVAESLVGDITPVDNVAKSEKNRRESTTMDYLCQQLLGKVDGGAQGREIREIWQEYEDSVTPESLFVHDVDKLELILQMVEYEKTYADGGAAVAVNGQAETGGKSVPFDLGEFTWVAEKIQTPEAKQWAREVLKERADFWASRNFTSVRGFSMEV